MNTQSWTYLDDRGGRHEVNLYHSPRDGKLLVQVDKQTVIATVHAHKGGRWTFMVEDELCDVVLFRRGLEFLYAFEINRHADTPRNRAIKIRNRRDFLAANGHFSGRPRDLLDAHFWAELFFQKKRNCLREISSKWAVQSKSLASIF